jgi:formylglycine-generating enzyme required for sulfatase activity
MGDLDSELSREELLQRYGTRAATARSDRRSPFKFLDSYDIDDADIFFGRDSEIDELLQRFLSDGHVVVYGESGSGKSSLVQCGLRSRIPEADALFVPVRVHMTGLSTICRQICESTSQHPVGDIESSSETGLVETLRAAHHAASRPIVLFFDQFEELFIFHNSEVRLRFAQELASIRTARLKVKIIIGVRQDYLGHLSELEDTVAGLFDNRFWLRRMSRENAAQAVVKACAICDVATDANLAHLILQRLDPGGQGVELPYLQVVMDCLYRQAIEDNSVQPHITEEEVRKLGDITRILGTFLVDEVSKLPLPGTGRQILKAFVTRKATRRTLNFAAVAHESAGFDGPIPPDVLKTHLSRLVSVRILREIADSGTYELRHDALATTVFSWISEVEKELIEVRDNLLNRLKEYEARDRNKAALLDQGFLDYLAVYEKRLRPLLTDTVCQYLDDSRRHVERAALVKRRATSAAMILILALAVFSWHERGMAERRLGENLVKNLLLSANRDTNRSANEYNKIIHELQEYRTEALPHLKHVAVTAALEGGETENMRIEYGRQRADAAIALFRLNEPTAAIQLLRIGHSSSDPTRTAVGLDPEPLTQFVHRCKERGVTEKNLGRQLKRLMADRLPDSAGNSSGNVAICHALLLALGDYDVSADLLTELRDWYRNDRSSGIHSACGWLLRRWQDGGAVEKIDREVARGAKKNGPDLTREWFVLEIDAEDEGSETQDYLTFVVVEEHEFVMGSPLNEIGRFPGKLEEQHSETIEERFAVCDREVSHSQLKRLVPDAESEAHPESPATFVSALTAEKYCEELTARSELTFRLPLEKEWECACRAGTVTRFSFGSDDALFESYGCLRFPELPRIAERRPSVGGLFDIHGNVKEWCRLRGGPVRDTPTYVVRGGGGSAVRNCRSAAKETPSSPGEYCGFRLCVTLPRTD